MQSKILKLQDLIPYQTINNVFNFLLGENKQKLFIIKENPHKLRTIRTTINTNHSQ